MVQISPDTRMENWDGSSGYHYSDNTIMGFSHSNEFASPGYYSVLLDDYHVHAELTATARSGFHQYTFPASDSSNIIIDLRNSALL